MSAENVIVCENLKFTYPDAPSPAINGINFTVAKGEFLSVIGHNGSGKSTLARLLNGLLVADRKSVV